MKHSLPYLSASRLNSAEQCLRLYEQHYVVKRPTAGAAPQLEFGTMVHEVLEHAVSSVIRTNYHGRVPVDRLLSLFERKWAGATLMGVEWFVTGRDIMERWAGRMGRIDAGVIEGVEVKFELPMTLPSGGATKLLGYIDRIDRVGPGHYRVIDYKTSRSIPSQAALDVHTQLSMYDVAVRRMYPDAQRVELQLDMLRHGVVVTTERTAKQREDFTDYLRLTAVQLGELEQWPAQVGRLCSWCDYREDCNEYQKAVGGFTAYPVPLDDVEAVASERERAALVEKLAKARKEELDQLIKTAVERSPEGSVTAATRRYLIGSRRSISYDVPFTIAAVGSALGLPLDEATAKVATIAKGRLTAALRGLDRGERMLVTADIEAAGTPVVRTFVRGEAA